MLAVAFTRKTTTNAHHIDQNDATLTSATPTHFPDNHNHRLDVLDAAIMIIANMEFDIENLNELSSDHNPYTTKCIQPIISSTI